MGQIKNIKLHIVTDIKKRKMSRNSMALKLQVLGCYRLLNRTCQKVFAGDPLYITAAQLRIKEGFRANAHVTDPEETADMLQYYVRQVKYCPEKALYELKIPADTRFEDNPPIKSDNVLDLKTYTVPDKYKPS